MPQKDVNENCKLSSIEMGMHFGGGMASKVTGNVKFDMSKVTGNVKFDKADQLTDLGFLRNVNSIEDLILVKCKRREKNKANKALSPRIRLIKWLWRQGQTYCIKTARSQHS